MLRFLLCKTDGFIMPETYKTLTEREIAPHVPLILPFYRSPPYEKPLIVYTQKIHILIGEIGCFI